MNVRVVTDSTAHLAPDVVRALNISIVPHHILIDGREYLDGVDLPESDFSCLVYEQGQDASTQPPTVEEFYAVYRDLNQDSSEIVSIHVSEVLSDTVKNARQAAGMLLGRCKTVVIDSQTLSMGLGILVETAARAAAAGQSLDEIVRTVRGLVPQIYIVFFSENLEYLERGGRIGHAQALLGTMLGIRPFLTLEEGEIRPMEKVRTREEALEKRRVKTASGQIQVIVGMGTCGIATGARDTMKAILEYIEKENVPGVLSLWKYFKSG